MNRSLQVLIIEDERIAADYLSKQLVSIDKHIEVVGMLESVSDSVEWLSKRTPDLIFMDIHLADDISFRIFEQTTVQAPVIFTTAFDQYAIRAFKVNSIDYLLKPIDKDELEMALGKFRERQLAPDNLARLIREIQPAQKSRRNRFLLQRGTELIAVQTEEIAYCFAEDKVVFITTHDGREFIADRTLDKLEHELPEDHFFRVNRKVLLSDTSIRQMHAYSKSRVKLQLKPATRFEVIVSVERASKFKSWMDS